MNNLEECDRIAKSRNGQCLSREYLGLKSKLTWLCENNHTWDASLKRIKYNQSWCPFCMYQSMRYPFDELQKVANDYNGKSLATEYHDARSKLLWECKEGHHWLASLWEVKQGRWCLKCKKNEKEEQLIKEALSLKFELVDSKKAIRSVKLNWKCQQCDQVVKAYFKDLEQYHQCELK